MANRIPPGDALLAGSPYLKKWLHVCGACGRVGHEPDCPDSGPVCWSLKRSYSLLELNHIGLCPACDSVSQDASGRA